MTPPEVAYYLYNIDVPRNKPRSRSVKLILLAVVMKTIKRHAGRQVHGVSPTNEVLAAEMSQPSATSRHLPDVTPLRK